CGMTLFNGICDNYIYGNGKPIICTACGSMVKGGLCLPCDFREKNLYNCDPNAYSFDKSNYFPQSQNENHLCNLCENNSHDGYDCQQQFSFVYEQEFSYNQNYDSDYYSHDLPSFPCCDNYRESHETFQCQPITFQIDFSGSDQIKTPQYLKIHPLSPKTSDEVFQANHSIQNEESFENPSEEIAVSSSNPEEPPQDSDIYHLIREKCSTEISEEQKQSMEDTMLELVKICQEKEFLCIHDDVDDLIESALNSKLLLINSNSQRLYKKKQEVKNHLSITPETESDEVTESNAENLLPIPSECEVALEDKRECDVPISENSPVCDNHSDIFSNSKIDDDISVYDDDFENIEYVEAPLPDLKIVSVEEQKEKESNNSLLDNFSPEFETFWVHSEETRSEEADLFLAADNSIPSVIENFADDPEGDICFLEELLIDDFILYYELSDSNFEDNPLIPRPPPEPPDVETDAGEEIPVVMNNKDNDVDYSSFIFIFDKVFSLLSAEIEDTIFDPGSTYGVEDTTDLVEGVANGLINKSPSNTACGTLSAADAVGDGDDLVSKFINQFFPPSKTTNLRNEITNFQQHFDESFSESWDRFKDLIRACPHHGFSKLHQLDTFYNALNSKDQDSLNSAAGGNFLDKMPRECLSIIESKFKVRYSRNKPVVAKVSTNASTFVISHDVAELKDMVKALLLDKKSQSPAPVKAIEESCVTCGGAHSYRNCPATDGNVYRDNIQEFISQAFANRFIPNQNRGNNFNQGTVYQPSVFQPPAYQAPAYQVHAPQPQGISKEYFSTYVKANDAVMRNMQTQGQNMQNQLTNLTDLITKFVNSNSASNSSSGTLPSNTIANPRSDLKAISTRSGVSYDGPKIPPLTSFLSKVVENEPEATKDTPITSPIFEPAIAPVCASKPNPKTSIPYPSSFADALILMPKFASSHKALIGNKVKLSEMALTSLNEHCFVVLVKKLPKKLGDPGKFLIPCDFPGMAECLALADLDASINLMPFSVWKRLYLPVLTPTCMTLELADHSISRPIGVAEDVDVKRSFLKTGRDLNDVFEEVDAFLAIEDDPTSTKFSQPYLDPEGDILLLEAFLKDDPSPPPSQGNYLPEVCKELKIYKAKSDKSSVDEPPEVELKNLPPHLKYAFLEDDDKLSIIIAKDLSVEEKTALITVLKCHKRAITWKLFDIKGIDRKFCTHKILMEEDFKPAFQHHRRVNPKIHDVIKQEVIKLLEARLIYPISDSPWVSPVLCVPNKGGSQLLKIRIMS
nr:hypothetical protein [Tanacetum cinerariifolium]